MYPASAPLGTAPSVAVDSGPLAVGTIDVETGTLELREPSVAHDRYDHVFALLRRDGWPVGVDIIPLDDEAIRVRCNQLGGEVPRHEGRRADGVRPFSVVMCTRNRPHLVESALTRLLPLLRGDEMIVVDNAPETSATAEVVARFPGVRYVVEPRPGLARARNCGLGMASHRYVVFTDDDIDPDPMWLDALAGGFADHPGAVAVSGSVLPMSLSTPAELRFQEFGGYVADFTESTYHLSMDPPPSDLFPFHPRLLGTGANTAFRAEALRSIGGFDEALGAGTGSRGGEDIDIAVRLLHAGHLLVRQPAAVVWHRSAVDDDELRRQIEGYGCGLAAAFSKFITDRTTAGGVIKRLPIGVRTALSSSSVKNERRSTSYPRELRSAELRGMARGAIAYHRTRREQRRERRRTGSA